MSTENTLQVLDGALADWIFELYQQARLLPQQEFKTWCFNHLGALIDFDSALWVSRSDMAEKENTHWAEDTFLYKQPVSFIQNYSNINARPNNPDPLNQYLSANVGRFCSLWDCCA
ncbi:MAG: hypothetical protein MJK04_12680, partial [Psychrosphaera sp.]|nr:hypothetical protein [Psychrosphaera sp.]